MAAIGQEQRRRPARGRGKGAAQQAAPICSKKLLEKHFKSCVGLPLPKPQQGRLRPISRTLSARWRKNAAAVGEGRPQNPKVNQRKNPTNARARPPKLCPPLPPSMPASSLPHPEAGSSATRNAPGVAGTIALTRRPPTVQALQKPPSRPPYYDALQGNKSTR